MSKRPAAPPAGDRPPTSAPPPPPAWRHWLLPLALLVALLLWVLLPTLHATPQVSLNYSQFLSKVSSHQVKTATIASDGVTTGTLANGSNYRTVVPVQLAGPPLLSSLHAAKVQVTATPPGPSFGSEVLSWLLLLVPFLVLGWLWLRLSRGGAGRMQGLFGVGRARAKVFDTERPSTTFADVAGYEAAKAEVAEVVDFLRQPERYQRAGATAPRGVLMVGPPGTGKTLLARAVAGEAAVPFYSVVASSFVEMFVGVGAARVRDLFNDARRRAPVIIFVDELDAIGQRRTGAGAIAPHDEREQTLNQLLSEMDGFDPSAGIVVLAATNRPEVLDPALLRPGRFDRRVVIPLPNLAERAEILAVHCRGKRLAPDVDLAAVARGTPGFSGADLANLVNEAAIGAARDDREVIRAGDFADARDRIMLGRREGVNVLLPMEKRAVAVHESGHALVAALSAHADPVAKVTILPAREALGLTEQLPLVERHLFGEDYLHDALAVRLAGRAAELAVLGQGSTGSANDLAQATELAVKMVREFGLSSVVGPVSYPEGGPAYLGGGGGPGLPGRPFAEATQAAIDAEVSRLLREAEQRAADLISTHRPQLDELVAMLMERETLDGSVVYRLVGRPVPVEAGGGETVAPHRAAPGAPGPRPSAPPAPGEP